MAECNSIEYNSNETLNIYPNLNAIRLNGQQQFSLNKINEIKDYFVADNKGRKLISKRLTKCIACFDYFVLSVTCSSISIASFTAVIGAPAGITSSSVAF